MTLALIQQRLDTYDLSSKEAELHAIKEIIQEIALSALARTDFFKHAAFVGGTCLRILYQLPRFSEDLDFSLLVPDGEYQLTALLDKLALEFASYDLNLETKDRSQANSTIRKAFLKEDSFGKVLQLTYARNAADVQKVIIKLEIDTNPPAFANTESVLVRFPFPFSVRSYDLPSLCAGKCNALLCREYIKGRDWFDFLWYVSREIKPNLKLLSSSLNQNGPWKNQHPKVTINFLKKALHDKVDLINWESAINEIKPFLMSAQSSNLTHWNTDYFHSAVELFLR